MKTTFNVYVSQRSKIQFENEDHAVYMSFRSVTTTLSSLRTTTCDALIVPSDFCKDKVYNTTPAKASVWLAKKDQSANNTYPDLNDIASTRGSLADGHSVAVLLEHWSVVASVRHLHSYIGIGTSANEMS